MWAESQTFLFPLHLLSLRDELRLHHAPLKLDPFSPQKGTNLLVFLSDLKPLLFGANKWLQLKIKSKQTQLQYFKRIEKK